MNGALAGSIAREHGTPLQGILSVETTNGTDTREFVNFNRYKNNQIDDPADGHYATIPGVEYLWWMQFEVALSTKFNNRKWHICNQEVSGGEPYKVLDQIGADDPSEGLVWPNRGCSSYTTALSRPCWTASKEAPE